MDAAQIVHDIQASYLTEVTAIERGESAKEILKGLRGKHASDIAEITDETQQQFIEQLLVECEESAK